LAGVLGLMLENCGGIRLKNEADTVKYMKYVSREASGFLLPQIGLFVIMGIAASAIQFAPRIVFDRVMPDVSRISLLKGWGRLFGLAGFIGLAKMLLKILIIGGAIGFSLSVDQSLLIGAIRSDPRSLPAITANLLIHLTSVVCIMSGLLAVADWAWTRFEWRRDLCMSRQELKEEFKQSEGDAFVKSRMRSLAQSRARKRMMSAVPRATMVVANPTHYAIALRYVRDEGGAPLVVAKGKDLIAQRIREIADEHGIPVIERKELVRAMFDHVEIDRMIPPEFFRPIAEVIHFLTTAGAKPAR